MSDLIKRLRSGDASWELREKAADEIERLKADYDECYQDLVDETLRANAAEECIDKLQAALESIANNTCCEGCQEARRVAIAALEVDDD